MLVYKEYSIKGNIDLEDILNYLLIPFLNKLNYHNKHKYGKILLDILRVYRDHLVFNFIQNQRLFVGTFLKDIFDNPELSHERKKNIFKSTIDIIAYKRDKDRILSNVDYYLYKLKTQETIKCKLKILNTQIINNLDLIFGRLVDTSVIKNYMYIVDKYKKTDFYYYHRFHCKTHNNTIYTQCIIDLLNFFSNYLNSDHIEKIYDLLWYSPKFFPRRKYEYSIQYNFLGASYIGYIPIIKNLEIITVFSNLIYKQKLWNEINETSVFRSN